MERRNRKTMINIPAGIQDGMQVRLTGEGNVGANGGPPGNLYILVDVKPHRVFERDQFDLLYTLPLNVAEAALGTEKDIPTLEGDSATVKIPQGTQHGAEFRVRGRGISHINNGRKGDLRVFVDVQVPGRLNGQQRKLLEELARSLDPNFDKEAAEAVEGAAADGDDPESWNGVVADEEYDDYANNRSDKDKGLFDRIKDVLS